MRRKIVQRRTDLGQAHLVASTVTELLALAWAYLCPSRPSGPALAVLLIRRPQQPVADRLQGSRCQTITRASTVTHVSGWNSSPKRIGPRLSPYQFCGGDERTAAGIQSVQQDRQPQSLESKRSCAPTSASTRDSRAIRSANDQTVRQIDELIGVHGVRCYGRRLSGSSGFGCPRADPQSVDRLTQPQPRFLEDGA